MNSSDMLRKIQ